MLNKPSWPTGRVRAVHIVTEGDRVRVYLEINCNWYLIHDEPRDLVNCELSNIAEIDMWSATDWARRKVTR